MGLSGANKKAREQARALIDRNEMLLGLAGEFFAAQEQAAKVSDRYEQRAAKLAATRDAELSQWRQARARAARAMLAAGASRSETATRLGITGPQLTKLAKQETTKTDTPTDADTPTAPDIADAIVDGDGTGAQEAAPDTWQG